MNPRHHVAPEMLAAGFAHGFSAPPRSFGVTPEGDAHRALARAVGYELDALRTCRQVHGAEVLVDPPTDGCEARDADAIVLRHAPGAAAVRTADCASILLAHKGSGAVAAVHAGWRGVVAGVVPAALSALGSGTPSEVIAALGPCIGPCCFEVGEEVAEAISAACGSAVTRPGPRGRPHVDLAAAVVAQLARAGVSAIERVGGCTVCSAQRWHSYRRDGAQSGRMLAVIAAPARSAR